MARRADPRQLLLDLPARPALGRDAFFVAPCNAAALALIETWRAWPGRRMVLSGPPASGKTHLAHVWAAEAGADILPAAALASLDPSRVSGGPLAVEGADTVAGDPAAELALFHLHNLMQTQGHALLLTAREVPARWRLALPDLASRMQGAPLAQLDAPDDAVLRAVLIKLFADRQLSVQPNLIDYVVTRMDRSFAAARDLVARLDADALATRSPITREMAARALDTEGAE